MKTRILFFLIPILFKCQTKNTITLDEIPITEGLEDLSEYSARYNEDENEDVEIGNTSDFLEEYVDHMSDSGKEDEKVKLKKLLKVIYDEALNMDE